MTIDEIRQALSIQNGSVTLSPSTLNSPRITALLQNAYAGQPLTMQQAVPGVGDGLDQVVINCTSTLLNVALPLTAAFIVGNDGEADCVLEYAPPSSWRFSQCFPNMPGSVDFSQAPGTQPIPFFDRLLALSALGAPRFVVTSNAWQDRTTQINLAAGINFLGILSPANMPGVLSQFIGKVSLNVAGQVVVPLSNQTWPAVSSGMPPGVNGEAVPGICLRAMLGDDWQLAGLQLTNRELQLYCPLDKAWLEQYPDYVPMIACVGALSVGGVAKPALVALETPLGADAILLYLQPEAWTLSNLTQLGGLLGADDAAAVLPSDFSNAITQTLNAITLEMLLLEIKYDSTQWYFDYAAITVGLPRVVWKIIPNYLELSQLAATFSFVRANANAPVSVSATCNGQFNLGNVALEVSVRAPDGFITAQLAEGQVIPLGQLLQQYLPGVVPPGSLNLKRLRLVGLLSPQRSFLIAADISEVLNFNIAGQSFGIDDLQFELGYSTTGGMSAMLRGEIEILNKSFVVAASHPQSNAGWQFSGGLAEGESLSLAAIAATFLPKNLQLPKGWGDLNVTKLAMSWNTQSQRFTFSGEVALTVALAHKSFQVTTTLQIESALSSTGKRTTQGSLTGNLTLGNATFNLSYIFTPNVQTLKGVWQNKSQSLDYTGLAQSFGCKLPRIDVDLSFLALKSASFEIDYSKTTGGAFLLSGSSQRFGQAFCMIAQDAQAQWGFAFGVDLPKAVKPSQLPVIGTSLGFADFLVLQSAFIIVSSTAFKNFRVPNFTGLQNFDVQLAPGATLGAVIDFASSAKTSQPGKNIQQLLGKPTLLLDATLSSNPANIALTVELGSLPMMNKVRLENAAFVIKLDPPAIMLQGSVNFNISGNTYRATGGFGLTDEEVEASFNIEAEGRQGIVLPLGLKGVHFTDIGLMVALDFVKEEISLGLEGKFWIGAGQQPTTATPSAYHTMPTSNEFVGIFSITDLMGLPNLDLLSLYLAEVDFDILIMAIFNKNVLPQKLQAAFNNIKASELLLYWCETPEPLPDGTFAYPLLGFNGNVQIAHFFAHAGFKIDTASGVLPAITGSASMSPIKISYHGRNVLQLTGSGKATPSGYIYPNRAIAANGPFVSLSTVTSPYLNVAIQVAIFGNTFKESINAQVTSNGFAFQIKNSVGGYFNSDFDCTLNGVTYFRMAFSVRLDLDVVLPVFNGVELGNFSLHSGSDPGLSDMQVELVVNLGSTFSLTIDGCFQLQGEILRIPTITMSEPLSKLEDIPAEIFAQIKNETASIFKKGLDEARDFLSKYGHDILKFGEAAIGWLGRLFVNRHKSNVPLWMQNGRFVQASGPAIYRIQDLQKRHVPDPPTLTCLAGAKPKIEPLPDLILASIIESAALPSRAEGTLLRASDDTKFFVMQGCKRHHIPDPVTFELNDFQWNQVVVIAPPDLHDIHEGDAFKGITLDDGDIVKGSGVAMYLMQKKQRRHIPDPATLNCIQSKRVAPIRTFSDQTLGMILAGIPLPSRANGVLLRARNHNDVFLMEGCVRRIVPSAEIFNANGFRWQDVREIEHDDLTDIPEGKVFIHSMPEGTLFKGTAVEVYLLQNDKRRHVPDIPTLQFLQNAGAGTPRNVSDDIVNKIAKGEPLPSRADGTLLKATNDKIVYVMQGGRRRAIPDDTVFKAHSFREKDINKISPEDLSAIPVGLVFL